MRRATRHSGYLGLTRATVAVALALGGRVAVAEDAGPAARYSESELETMHQIAVKELDTREGRCASASGGVSADPESERVFARSALNIYLVLSSFEFPEGREDERDGMVHRVVLGYERAFECNPGWDKRHYLNEALAVLDEYLKQQQEGEGRSVAELIADRERVQRRLAGLQAPACATREQLCASANAGGTSQAPPVPSGYRAWAERLSLRLEFGGGLTLYRPSEVESALGPTFGFQAAPGLRFLAGRQLRHVFVFGFLYGVHRVADGVDRENVHTMLVRLEYGVRVHRRWFSIHGALEPGFVIGGDDPFGRSVIAGSGALCTWGEALCARVRGYWAPPRATEANALLGLVGLDLFRVIDNVVMKGEPR